MPPLTYAESTKKKITPLTSFDAPTEEQGIIFNHVDGTKICEYLMAIYELVGGAQNILAASRVSGGKVIIFLASKEIVAKFQLEYSGFDLNGAFVKTRKLKTPAYKIVLSNVSPTIPNSVLEEHLKTNLGLRLVSPMSILRVSPSHEIFSHVVSWRRQVYVHSETDPSKIPVTIQLEYSERIYRIFINTDEFICFKCGTKGHKADACTHMGDDEETEDVFSNKTVSQISATSSPISDFPPLFQPPIVPSQSNLNPNEPNPSQPDHKTHATKRGPSTIASTASTEAENQPLASLPAYAYEKVTAKKDRKRRKKAKIDNTADAEKYCNPLKLTTEEKDIITEAVNHTKATKHHDCDIDAEGLIQFLSTLRGTDHKLEHAKTYTQQLPHLHFILDEIKPKMESGTKRTITAFLKCLRNEYTSSSSDQSDADT